MPNKSLADGSNSRLCWLYCFRRSTNTYNWNAISRYRKLSCKCCRMCESFCTAYIFGGIFQIECLKNNIEMMLSERGASYIFLCVSVFLKCKNSSEKNSFMKIYELGSAYCTWWSANSGHWTDCSEGGRVGDENHKLERRRIIQPT